jgi:hypothetical protein
MADENQASRPTDHVAPNDAPCGLLELLSYQLNSFVSDEVRPFDTLLMHGCDNCEGGHGN